MKFSNSVVNKLPKKDAENPKEHRSSNHSTKWRRMTALIVLLAFPIFLTLLALLVSIFFNHNSRINSSADIHESSLNDASRQKNNLNIGVFEISKTKNFTSMKLKKCTFLNFKRNSSDCIPTMSFELGSYIFKSHKSEVLGNKKIILFGIGKKTTPNSNGSLEFHIYEDHLRPRSFEGPYDNQTLGDKNPLQIIPYQKTFDFFIKSFKHCSPPGSFCLIRYSDQGKKLRTLNFPNQTKLENMIRPKLYSLKKFDPSSGYIHISSQGSLVESLNQKLKVIKKKVFEDSITTSAISNGNIGICTDSGSNQPTKCFKLNSQLEVEREYSLVSDSSNRYWKLLNLANGDFLAFARAELSIGPPIEVKRLAKDGSISRSHYLIPINCNLSRQNLFENFQERFGKYCFSFICDNKSVTLRCLNRF